MRYTYYGSYGFDGIRVQIAPIFCGELNPNRLACLTDMYSISAWSENQDAAWDFLSFLIREDIQDLWTLIDRPVNVNVREARLEESINSFYEEDIPIGQQYIAEMQNIYALVDNVDGMQDFHHSMILCVDSFVRGDQTLEAALTNCERELRMIMNES